MLYPAVYILIVYFMSSQPLEVDRFFMYLTMGIMTSLVAQSIGLAIGAALPIQVRESYRYDCLWELNL